MTECDLTADWENCPAVFLARNWTDSVSEPAERPFANGANELIRRVAIRARDVLRSADALADLANRFEAFPLLTHKTRLTMLKEDVVKMRDIVLKLHGNRSSMDEWQGGLVERIAPKCKSSGEDVDAAFLRLDGSPQRMFATIYMSLGG